MAKLGKEKFNVAGYHKKHRTTFSGQVELYLYYNSEKHFFYFDHNEMKKYFPESTHEKLFWLSFKHFDTRDKAIKTVQTLLDETSVKKRMLRIELNMPSELYKVPNTNEKKSIFDSEDMFNPELPEYLREMLWRSSMQGSGLRVEFERIMKIESNGYALYLKCDKDWNYNVNGGTYERNIIEWTPEREVFLISLQAQIDELCKKVLGFFTAKNIDEFFLKVENGQKLIATNQ